MYDHEYETRMHLSNQIVAMMVTENDVLTICRYIMERLVFFYSRAIAYYCSVDSANNIYVEFCAPAAKKDLIGAQMRRHYSDRVEFSLETNTPFIVHNVSKMDTEAHWRDFFTVLGLGAVVLLPLTSEGRRCGCLLFGYAEPHDWSQERLFTLTTLASYLAMVSEQNEAPDKKMPPFPGTGTPCMGQQEDLLQLASVIADSDDAIFRLSPDCRIQTWNPSAQRIYGYEDKEICGQHVFALLSPAHKQNAIEEIRTVMQGKRLNHYETKHLTRDGQSIDVSLSISPVMNQTGAIGGCYVIARDVTERNQMRDQLLHMQKMEAIATLAGGIAHDFNNILAVMLGFTELALEEAVTDSPLEKNLSQVLKAGERARDLVQQILTFSRESQNEKCNIFMIPLIKETIKFMRATLPSNVKICIDYKTKAGRVFGDLSQIHQLVVNLCVNAGHAMQGTGGVLKIVLAEAAVNEQEAKILQISPGDYIQLTVSDNGSGMDQDIRERIFDPFFTNKSIGEGSGMGLAAVYGIVKGHDGAISVDSLLGIGSTFTVYLPAAPETTSNIKESALQPPAVKLRILLVDDEEAIVEVLQSQLIQAGYEVTATQCSTQALEIFMENPDAFDLVITDYTMPTMTGDTLAREILCLRPGMPIILCTGYSHAFPPDRAKMIGIRQYIMKPVLKKDLLFAVEQATQRMA
ncbi:response regulator [Heliobacterium gestii]|uniref:Stage 0 sporulation protein A homolog n=1 Tax=Heliomicrobium gestii TaxID=2699 RepID=A0A845LEB0_HELGE|nr:response regulator [Heliomicrobium gestii]MBM7867929.1 PAS domain S-box-containing protein [Heliomicrobium gestii]MZP43260.1 response regulator [Heliomicrobium gestii]